MARKTEMPSDEKAQLLLETVEDRKAEDPVLLDLRGKTLLADFFLICSGTSQPHIRAIAEHVLEVAKERRLPAPRIEGEQVGEWVLLDFGDVILHVMAEEPRQRYKLEQFWTTPHPKGALPPTPGSVSGRGTGEEDDEGEGWDEDEGDLDEDERDDAAFFDEADQEVEPIDEEDDDLEDARPRDTTRGQRV